MGAPKAIEAPPVATGVRKSEKVDYGTLADVVKLARDGWVQPFGDDPLADRKEADSCIAAYKRAVAREVDAEPKLVQARAWEVEGGWTFAVRVKPDDKGNDKPTDNGGNKPKGK